MSEAKFKQFSIEAVLGLVGGVILKDGVFGEMHELGEHVLGHAVWTHEFADEVLSERMRAALVAQHPLLGKLEAWNRDQAKQNLGEYLAAYVERQHAKYGSSLPVERGTGERTENPIESLRRMAPDKSIIVVAAPDEKT